MLKYYITMNYKNQVFF